MGMGEVQWGPGTLSAFLMILYLIFCIFWDVFNFVCVPVIFKLLRFARVLCLVTKVQEEIVRANKYYNGLAPRDTHRSM